VNEEERMDPEGIENKQQQLAWF